MCTNMGIIGRKMGKTKKVDKKERQKTVSQLPDIERKECRTCNVSLSHSDGVEDSNLLGVKDNKAT